MAFRSDDALAYSLAVYFDLSIIGIGVFFYALTGASDETNNCVNC
jgi:hypothetical protein